MGAQVVDGGVGWGRFDGGVGRGRFDGGVHRACVNAALGAPLTARLVRALWGGDRVLPRPGTTAPDSNS